MAGALSVGLVGGSDSIFRYVLVSPIHLARDTLFLWYSLLTFRNMVR